MISLWASSFFGRTASALVVSYLMILPLAIGGVLAWNALGQLGEMRLLVATTVVPIACLATAAVLWKNACDRLLYPNDLGSGGKDAVDLDSETTEAVGLYIKRDEWPDRLFAPPKRTDFLEEGANPIYDKEMRSEIFSQGTLMLRLVIQISMVLAIPIMAICLYVWPWLAPWYLCYVLMFNLLCGPVFSAGSVCSERERQTLDLLLTTLITPWQMLTGKLLSGLRVSTVLTCFLMWPVLLACVMPSPYWTIGNLLSIIGYVLIAAIACLTTSLTALTCSALCSKTSTALIASYVVLIGLFLSPIAMRYFAETFYTGTQGATGQGTSGVVEVVAALGVLSPFSALFALPLEMTRSGTWAGSDAEALQAAGEPLIFWGHLVWSLVYNGALLGLLAWLFQTRWRVAE